MKTGFSANAFTNTSLSYAIKTISKIGFEGIEIVLDYPHAFLPIKKSESAKISKHIKQNKIQVTNLNSNTVLGWHKNKVDTEKFEPSLSSTNQKLRKWRIDYTKKALDLAVKLESPSISITSGLKSNKKEVNLENFKKSLEELAIYAEKNNTKIAIEYEPGLLLENSSDVYPFIFNHFSNVGLNFDVCHAQVLGENIPKVIKKFHKKIFHTHISDCKNKIHYHLIPGLGDVNFDEMFDAFTKINYNGFLTCELYTYSLQPENAAKASFIYLKKLMAN